MNRLHDVASPRLSFSRRTLLTGAGAGIACNLAADVDPAAIQPLHSLGHICWGTFGGAGGYWKTSFVFVNTLSSAASVRLVFYTQAGAPLFVPVVGGSRVSQLVVDLPGYGSAVVELDEAADALSVGWVGFLMDGVVRVQGIFKVRNPGYNDCEAVVPMVSRAQPSCIIPLPPAPAVLALPFDNTQGYVTSVAFANTAMSGRTLDLEFRDMDASILHTAHEDLAAHNQVAFATSERYPLVTGKKGWMRVLASVSDFTALGFRFSPSVAFTTWLPILT